MNEASLRSGWGVLLRGHESDLQDYRAALKPPFDPWVQDTPEGLALRSEEFDAAASAREAHDRAGTLQDVLNGAMALSFGSKPVALSGVVELMSDGRCRKHVFVSASTTEACDRASAEGFVLGPDGKPLPPPPPRPSQVQQWLLLRNKKTKTIEFILDAMIYYSRRESWFDIYKSIECIRDISGSDNAFFKLPWVDQRIKQVKQMAQQERHRRGKYEPPSPPVSKEDAQTLVAALIKHAIEHYDQEANAANRADDG